MTSNQDFETKNIYKQENKKPGRILHAIRYSIDGLKTLWKNEQAFRQEFYLSIILLPIIYFLPVASLLKIILILLLFLLFVVETLNTAIETIVDRISLEIHEQSKIAKDMGSAAVCLVLIMNVIAWIYTLCIAYF